ncbi:hypothetical protein ACUTAF_19565 [Pseudomonas sp. SP16.1]|uniref:hypothetical protein n=1 Tax=Pseudomonas sp. SP16.1 TaxID=3458854 RepID=UPI0040455BAB
MGARPGTPKPPGSGRKRGSLDKAQRQLLTDKMAGDLMAVYAKLGGRKWLLEFAKAQPAEFIRQGLSRLFPAPQRDPDADAPGSLHQHLHVNQLSDLEAATRIAFVLSQGAYQTGPSPQESCRVPQPIEPVPADPRVSLLPPASAGDALDAERQRWASELQLSPEQRADAAAVRETQTSIEHYRGGSSEQGLARRRQLL